MPGEFTLSDVFSDFFKLLKNGYGPLLAAAFLALFLPQLILVVVDSYITEFMPALDLALNFSIYLSFFFLTIICSSWLYAGGYKVLLEKNFPLTLAKIFSSAKPYLLRYIFLSLLALIAVILLIIPAAIILELSSYYGAMVVLAALVLLFVGYLPFLYIYVRLMFCMFILVDQGTGVWSSLTASWKFTKGRFWTTIGYILLFVACTSTIILVLVIPGVIASFFVSGFWWDIAIMDVLPLFVGTLLFPVTAAYFVALYARYREASKKPVVVKISQPAKVADKRRSAK